MGWNKDGSTIRADYCGVVFDGVVLESRVKYGGTVQHTVELDDTITVFGALRNHVLVSGDEISGVLENV